MNANNGNGAGGAPQQPNGNATLNALLAIRSAQLTGTLSDVSAAHANTPSPGSASAMLAGLGIGTSPDAATALLAVLQQQQQQHGLNINNAQHSQQHVLQRISSLLFQDPTVPAATAAATSLDGLAPLAATSAAPSHPVHSLPPGQLQQIHAQLRSPSAPDSARRDSNSNNSANTVEQILRRVAAANSSSNGGVTDGLQNGTTARNASSRSTESTPNASLTMLQQLLHTQHFADAAAVGSAASASLSVGSGSQSRGDSVGASAASEPVVAAGCAAAPATTFQAQSAPPVFTQPLPHASLQNGSTAPTRAQLKTAGGDVSAATTMDARAVAPSPSLSNKSTTGPLKPPPPSASQTSSSGDRSPPPDPVTGVRMDKVQAALRSKPQRGRKRSDLSELDRLELTRTRNREHAKSTRLRKKARYQELLASEIRLKAAEEKERVIQNRRNIVQRFLSLRQTMLQQRLRLLSLNDGEGDQRNVTGKFKDDAGIRDASQQPTVEGFSEVVSTLRSIIGNAVDFHFSLDGAVVTGDTHCTKMKAIVAAFNEWDDHLLLSHFQRRDSNSRDQNGRHSTVVSVDIDGGMEGIASSDDGRCFASVQVSTSSMKYSADTKTSCVRAVILYRGILHAKFRNNSEGLTSMQWLTSSTSDNRDLFGQRRAESPSGRHAHSQAQLQEPRHHRRQEQEQEQQYRQLRGQQPESESDSDSDPDEQQGDDEQTEDSEHQDDDHNLDRVSASVVSLDRHGEEDPGNDVNMVL